MTMTTQQADDEAGRKARRAKRLSAHQQEVADAFDDALADTGSVREAAKLCDMALPAAEVRFTRLRKRMGWQAS